MTQFRRYKYKTYTTSLILMLKKIANNKFT